MNLIEGYLRLCQEMSILVFSGLNIRCFFSEASYICPYFCITVLGIESEFNQRHFLSHQQLSVLNLCNWLFVVQNI